MRPALRLLSTIKSSFRPFAAWLLIMSMMMSTLAAIPIDHGLPQWKSPAVYQSADGSLMRSLLTKWKALPSFDPDLAGRLTRAKAAILRLTALDTAPTVSQGLRLFAKDLLGFVVPTAGRRAAAPVAAAPPTPTGGKITYDFDGDGKADVSRCRIPQYSACVFKSSETGDEQGITFGSTSGFSSPGDFDGDGTTDLAVFVDGTWTIYKSTISNFATASLGTAGDTPHAGDFDADGFTDLAVFRDSNATWYIKESSTGNTVSTAFGASGDIPVAADYDGNGATDIATFRPSNGYWYIQGQSPTAWGMAGDVPVPGDYDGDGKTDIAVFRNTSGEWFILKSSNPQSEDEPLVWGNFGDQPAPADYDGDGKTDLAIWRPTTGVWHIWKSSNGQYEYKSLGIDEDVAVPSSYVKQVGEAVSGDDLAVARLSQRNMTGSSNLYSQNFHWGTTLVSLPGRSGMDAGIGISYNSLAAWVKEPVSNTMVFDPDMGNITPGFRFGFPTIERARYHPTKDLWFFVMVTPSGKRVEFLQKSVSGLYFSSDSSYTILEMLTSTDPNDAPEAVSIRVTTADGTRWLYSWNSGSYKCAKITDRNGNFITVDHNEIGLLTKVTDTLGREINFEYRTDLLLDKITQSWRAGNGSSYSFEHTYAEFSYGTKVISTYYSPAVWGPPNGTSLPVLDEITYSDGSKTKFEYNGYAQVEKIINLAADSGTRSYTSTDLDSVPTYQSQEDTPRFSETRSWAVNFNSNNEVRTNNSFTSGQNITLPDSHIISGAAKVEVWMPSESVHPNDLRHEIYFGNDYALEGLPLATRDCIANCSSNVVRWSWTDWLNDSPRDMGYTTEYRFNPAPLEMRVGDGANIKGTRIQYYTVEGQGQSVTHYPYGLPEVIEVYDTSSTNVRRKTEIEYNHSSAYLSRNIGGLPTSREEWGWNSDSNTLEYASKVIYAYDEGNFGGSGQTISALQHNSTDYGASFTVGRGNLTKVTRYKTSFESGDTSPNTIEVSKIAYNITGSPISQTDVLGRVTRIGYTDNFNSSTNGATYAYPTTITDAAGASLGDAAHSSTMMYRYDFGAVVEAVATPRASTADRKTVLTYFDTNWEAGKLNRSSIWRKPASTWIEHAYTRHEYPSNGTQSKAFSTLVDVNSSGGPDQSDEVLSEQFFDGAGRVIKTMAPHTFNGTATATLVSTRVKYDRVGRLIQQSVPTEVDSNGNPTLDDYRGTDQDGYIWLWNKQVLDWMGRPEKTIPPDSNGSDGKETLYSYSACGCAGGLVTTIQGPSVPRDDTSGNARRKQKIYEDILGRTFKTEIFKWDGSTVYTTTEHKFDGRDQILFTTQTDNTANPQTSQTVSMTYDGHGRMMKRHYPIEDANTHTVWAYNDDDSIATITDPRGAITAYTYENVNDDPKRRLITKIQYTPHSGGVDTPDVVFSYDNAGNRTGMDTDGVSNVTYAYDSLSRMTSETVDFDDLTNNLTIGYSYTLSGLKSITDPFGSEVEYTHDKAGKLTAVTGDPFGDNTTGNYLDNIQYRAFGQLKSMRYRTDDNATVSMDYDDRLRVSEHKVASSLYTGGYLKNATFTYTADSRPQLMDNAADGVFDRSFTYDFAGRLSHSEFGTYTPQQGSPVTPHVQDIQYDAFSNMTSRLTEQWGATAGFLRNYSATTGRLQAGSGETLTYDAAGNITYSGVSANLFQETAYDAAGRRTGFLERWATSGSYTPIVSETTTAQVFDGSGQLAKATKRTDRISSPAATGEPMTTYYVTSSVLGKPLTEIEYTGSMETRRKTRIVVGDAVIAEQRRLGTTDTMAYLHADPVTGSKETMAQSGERLPLIKEREEYEPLGQFVRYIPPPVTEDPPPNPPPVLNDAKLPEWQCQVANALGQQGRELPSHCSKAVEQDLSKGPVSSKEDGNPARAAHPSSRIPEEDSSANELMSYALSATKKDKKNNLAATAKQDSERGPSAGGDGIGCDPNDPDSCNITIYASDDPLDAISAENAGPASEIPAARPDCVVNINILNTAGVSRRRLAGMKRFMVSAYRGAGIQLAFNGRGPGKVAASVNLHLVRQYPEIVRQEILSFNPNILLEGVVGWSSFMIPGNVWVLDRARIESLNFTSLHSGRELGRTSSHEVGHPLLKPFPDPLPDDPFHSKTGIMAPNDFEEGPARDRFTDEQRQFFERCNFMNRKRR